jgi:hypothetical protein
MDNTRELDDDTPQHPSPPNVMSKSTNLSPSETKLTDSGSHRPTSGPTLQGRPSYVTMTRNALSDERLDSATGANPAAASGQSSRRRETRPTDNPAATAISEAASGGRQPKTERRDASRFDIELDARSRVGQQVRLRISAALLLLVILTSGPPLQPPSDVGNTQSIALQPISSSRPSDISASKEARAAQRDDVTNPGPILSASSTMRVTSQLRPVTSPPSSLNVLPSRELQETDNIRLGPPRPEETRERYESPFP